MRRTGVRGGQDVVFRVARFLRQKAVVQIVNFRDREADNADVETKVQCLQRLQFFRQQFFIPAGFERRDMICDQPDSKDRHVRQESEANTFAIELLAPLKRIRAYLRGNADLANVIAMSDELDISKEAAARRYVSKHPEPLAVVFSREEQFLYATRSKDFPGLSLHQNLAMPMLPRGARDRSEWEEVRPED